MSYPFPFFVPVYSQTTRVESREDYLRRVNPSGSPYYDPGCSSRNIFPTPGQISFPAYAAGTGFTITTNHSGYYYPGPARYY
jgi:hypothetical protein